MIDFTCEETLAASLENVATGYIAAHVLFAAVELGVFDELRAPCTVVELAERTRSSIDGMNRLCRVLCRMGLLAEDGDRLTVPPMVRQVLPSMHGVLRHHHRHVAPLLARLSEGVRTAAPQHAAWTFASTSPAPVPYVELARHPAEYVTFLEGMEHASRGVGRSIATAYDLSGARLLVDLGGGGGAVARELLSAVPELHVVSYDIGAACAFARARSEDAGLSDRHRILEGDLLTGGFEGGADVVLLSAVLADWPKKERAVILQHAYLALRPGGRLLVSETLLDDDRRGPLGAAVLSLVMLVGMRGDQLSGHELSSELASAGFVAPAVYRMKPRDLLVAERPL